MLEQEINLINEDKGLFAFCSVLRNAIQNTVENDKHTDRHKLLTEVKNIIADKTIVRIHIGRLCKGVE